MGDVGSGAIGFALAALATVAAARLGSRSWLILLPLSPFLVDAGLTLLRRIVRGERWWTPHTQHAYQAWARKRGHAWVALAYAATTAVASALGLWLSAESGTLFIACIVTAWYICCAFFWRWLQAERL
jgi:UDP-N-acetylmuramyl pentapeptide phosphotransferase/UDP-N-acetylglucosamine-1-phosphate transferase